MSRRAQGDAAGIVGRPLTPSRWGWVAVAASLALATVVWSRHIAAAGGVAGLFHDEGVYLVTARSLAEGSGYRVVSTPGAPAEVRYPPLLPLVLSGVWRLAPGFPANLPWLKGVSLLGALALAALLPGYLRASGFRPGVAFATAVLTAGAPLTMRYATAVVSELPFACLTVATLWLIERAARPGGRTRTAAVAGAMAGLAILTRSIGVALLAAGTLTLLRRADTRRALAFGLAGALLALPWAVWVLVQGSGAGAGYLRAFADDGPPGPAQILQHLLALPAAVGIVTIPGLADLLPAGASVVILLAVYLAGLVALVGSCRARFGGYVALSLAVAVTVPWFQPRFLLPLAPLFLASLLSALVPRGRGWPARAVSVALVGGLLVSSLAGNRAGLAGVSASGLPALEEGSSTAGTWSEVDAALTWVRETTRPDDVVATFHDPVVYLYTGRRAVQVYPSLWRPDASQVSATLAGSGARWLLDVPCPEAGVWAGAHAAWREWLDANQSALTPVHVSGAGRVRVFRLDPTLGRTRS